jgi:hypothetical protein
MRAHSLYEAGTGPESANFPKSGYVDTRTLPVQGAQYLTLRDLWRPAPLKRFVGLARLRGNAAGRGCGRSRIRTCDLSTIGGARYLGHCAAVTSVQSPAPYALRCLKNKQQVFHCYCDEVSHLS